MIAILGVRISSRCGLSGIGTGATATRRRRFDEMTQQTLDTPLDARVIDGEVVITGPEGFNGSMTLDAAKVTLERLQMALGAGAAAAEQTYQKPLG